MKAKLTLAVAVFFMLGLTGMAQEFPRYEVYTGYSLNTQKGDANINGWNGQVAVNFRKDFGLVADISGHQMGPEPGVNGVAGWEDVRMLSYTVGPRAYTRSLEPVSIFAHMLMGQTRLRGHEPVDGGGTERSLTRPFTMILGGGVDYPLNDRVGLRLIQVDYRLMRIRSVSSNGLRIGAGVTFTFN